MPNEDKDLVTALKNGDAKSFDLLFSKYNRRLYYFILKYLQSEEESEEVVQEIFLKIWFKKSSLDPNLSFRSYLFMIARNTVFNVLRKKVSRRKYEEEKRHEEAGSNMVDDEINFHELNRLLSKAIEGLPKKRKEVFLASRRDGLTIPEIAQQMGIAVKTVEAQLTLALKHVRSVLKDHDIFWVMAWWFYKM